MEVGIEQGKLLRGWDIGHQGPILADQVGSTAEKGLMGGTRTQLLQCLRRGMLRQAPLLLSFSRSG